MYVKYQYNAGATGNNILNDLKALLIGETNVNNLSSGCNKPSTAIIANVDAGWTLHDGSASASSVVLKAPMADDANTYKYLEAYISGTSYVLLKVWETWNASTHVGTNMAYASDNTGYGQRIDLTNGGTLYLFASSRFAMAVSNIAAGWGSANYLSPCGIFERSRFLPFDTVANGYPPVAWINFGYCQQSTDVAYSPRMPNNAMQQYTGSSATIRLGTDGMSQTVFNSTYTGSDKTIPDASGNPQVGFLPIYLNSTLMPAPYGSISTTCDVWFCPQGSLLNLDGVVKSSVNYLAIQYFDTTKLILIRKG